jgi:death-on-curing protein
MRYLSLADILSLHRRIMEEIGGKGGVRDWDLLRSAIAQPRVTFEGEDLYPSIVEKAAALGFSLAMNHPMIDGNKRLAHASMELFLMMNGFEIKASIDEQEGVMISLAAGELGRKAFTGWLARHVVEMEQ